MIPTLNKLRAFDTAHRNGADLSDMGLILSRAPEGVRSRETPKNSIAFASTGGDGVHYCLLAVEEQITEQSPVVLVVPCNSKKPQLIVGESLSDFLSLGCIIGYFFLEQLVYDFDRTLPYLFDYDAFLRNSYFGNEPPDEDLDDLAAQRALLADLLKEFSLKPWSEPRTKFESLQMKWSGKMQFES
jgi:hypothetical protein